MARGRSSVQSCLLCQSRHYRHHSGDRRRDKGPVDITSAYCLNTVPGNCLDCVAESQTGSGERREKHQPNCNAFHFLGVSRGLEGVPSGIATLDTVWTRHTSLSRLAAVAPLSCRRRRDPVSLRVCELPRIRQCFPKTKGEGPPAAS